MLLNGRGFVPGIPATRTICGRGKVIERWGLAVDFVEGIWAPYRGNELRDEDGEMYHLYVIELFERVHQRKLLRRVLPFHFARGLAVEAQGGSVNLVSFAMSRCFPRHKITPFIPLLEYSTVNAPLLWINKRVIPGAERVAVGAVPPGVQVILGPSMSPAQFVVHALLCDLPNLVRHIRCINLREI